MEEFAIFRGTSWLSHNYCLEGHFYSTNQISCDFNSIAQMISTSVFFALRYFRGTWDSRKAMTVCSTSISE